MPKKPPQALPQHAGQNKFVESKRTRHATDIINDPFVRCPKYRRPVLWKKGAKRLDERIREKATERKYEVTDLVIEPEPVPPFCSFPPTIALYQSMCRLNRYASHVLGETFSWPKSRMSSMETRSDFVYSTGHVSAV